MCLEWSRGLERARYLAGVETVSNEMSFQEHARSACAVPIKSDPSMCRPFALSTELRMNHLATDVGNDCSLGHRGAHHRYRRKRRDEEGDCNHHPNQLGKIKGRGTSSRRKPCLHVGWRGTRFGWQCAACGTKSAPALIEWRALSAGLGSAALEFMP